MKIELRKGEWIETDSVSTRELIALHDMLILERTELKGKVQEEWNKKKENGGHYDDTDRYGRLVFAGKKVGILIDRLRKVIADRRHAERASLHNRQQDAFVRICYERMPKELFESILEEANRRISTVEVTP